MRNLHTTALLLCGMLCFILAGVRLGFGVDES